LGFGGKACRRYAAQVGVPIDPALTHRANIIPPLRGWIAALPGFAALPFHLIG
jgi:hypothetical protein